METGKKSKKNLLLNRKKSDPNKFIFTGTKTVDDIDIQLFKYNNNECVETKNIIPSDIESLRIPGSIIG